MPALPPHPVDRRFFAGMSVVAAVLIVHPVVLRLARMGAWHAAAAWMMR
jgi:hypothetical protein